MTEQYTGPSAKRIAHRVSFDRGWFWTTTAICHDGRSDGLAFRQRPEREGIDVRCHTGGCSRGVVLTHLESLVGLPIWTAYELVADAAVKAPEKRPWWKRKRVVVAAVVALVVVEVGWEKWTPKSDKLERRRCQDEEGPARKVYQGIPAGSSEAGIGRESVIARGRASVVLTAIDVGVLGEAI